MKQFMIPAVALAAVIAQPAFAQTPVPDQLTQRPSSAARSRPSIWGMPAVNYDLMLQEMLTKTAGKVNQVIYWGRPLDWHNQTLTPNPDAIYFMAFFNTKDRADRARPAARRARRLVQRQHRQRLADAARGRRAARRRQGRGRQVPDPAAGLRGQGARGLHRAAVGHVRRLRADPLEPQEPRRRRRREVGRLRQAGQGLSAVAGRQSAGDGLHRREGRRCSTPPSATTRASSSTSTASCRASPGSIATGR